MVIYAYFENHTCWKFHCPGIRCCNNFYFFFRI
jgi:hypothetical protein